MAAAPVGAQEAPISNRWDLDAVPARTPGVLDVPIDGETLVVVEAAHELHHLDRIATAFWLQVDGQASLRQIATRLAAAFTADPGQVEMDLLALCSRLDDLGLLHGVGLGHADR